MIEKTEEEGREKQFGKVRVIVKLLEPVKSALANRRQRVMEACEATEQQITALQLDQATFRRFTNDRLLSAAGE